jgi:hypothetical protein
MTIGIAFSVRPTKMWIGFEIDIARRSLTICLVSPSCSRSTS